MTDSTTEAIAIQRNARELAAVRDVATRVAEVHGLDVVDVEWARGPKGRILRVTIEAVDSQATGSENGAAEADPNLQGAAPGQGAAHAVGIGDCVRVSRDLSTALDASDPISLHYNLEVTSPGIDRPLRTARDFRRQIGKLVKAKLHDAAVDGQMVLRGTVESVADDVVRIRVDGNVHEVVIENVRDARVVLDLGTPKPRSNNKAKRSRAGRGKARAAKGQHG